MSLKTEYPVLLDKVRKYSRMINDLPEISEYDFDKLLAVYEEFFKRHPMKSGSIVELKTTPEITEKTNWGWIGAKHWLKSGAKGKVVGLDYNVFNEKIQVTVEFFNQTWLDQNGVEHPIEKPYIYFINEEDLTLI